MGWKDGQGEADRDVLMRIVALLLSLAALAERAAGVSAARRREVLGFLLRGEAEARAFLIEWATGGMVVGMPAPADEGAPSGDACDAAHLAVRLRALALMLCVLMVRRLAFAGSAGPHMTGSNPAALTRTGPRALLPAPDTS